MERGTRVRIARGTVGVGQTGEVFWEGPDRYDEGTRRLGVRGDDGQTYWVGASCVDRAEGAAPAAPEGGAPPPPRGSRVRFTERGVEGAGEVFWSGPSKRGPGHRVGVKQDGTGETFWFDAHRVELIEGAAASALPPGGAPPREPKARAAARAPAAEPGWAPDYLPGEDDDPPPAADEPDDLPEMPDDGFFDGPPW